MAHLKQLRLLDLSENRISAIESPHASSAAHIEYFEVCLPQIRSLNLARNPQDFPLHKDKQYLHKLGFYNGIRTGLHEDVSSDNALYNSDRVRGRILAASSRIGARTCFELHEVRLSIHHLDTWFSQVNMSDLSCRISSRGITTIDSDNCVHYCTLRDALNQANKTYVCLLSTIFLKFPFTIV